MEYRILTGVLIPEQTPGDATIFFNPHQVTGDADGVNLEEFGDEGDFEQAPSGFVSLKHFTIQDRNRADSSDRIEIEECQIRSDGPTTDQMVVTWRATNGAEIKEIAYMIVGEA